MLNLLHCCCCCYYSVVAAVIGVVLLQKLFLLLPVLQAFDKEAYSLKALLLVLGTSEVTEMPIAAS